MVPLYIRVSPSHTPLPVPSSVLFGGIVAAVSSHASSSDGLQSLPAHLIVRCAVRVSCGMRDTWTRRRRRWKEERRRREKGEEEEDDRGEGTSWGGHQTDCSSIDEESSSSPLQSSRIPFCARRQDCASSTCSPSANACDSGDGRAEPHDRLEGLRPTRHQRYPVPRPCLPFLPHLLLFLLCCSLPPPILSLQCDSFPTWMPPPAWSPANSSQCLIWSSDVPSFLCAVSGRARLTRIQAVFLFSDSPAAVSLLDMLTGGSRGGNRVKAGSYGADCLKGDTEQCRTCFLRIDDAMQRVSSARSSFERVLSRFDCLPALDTPSATRPFSPNASCEHCKMWYSRWLASHVLEVWSVRPCIEWCYAAQLACPHLATSRVVDYAGHPSFQCRDLHIPSDEASACECVHPCDIDGVLPPNTNSLTALNMCSKRRARCSERRSSDTLATPTSCASLIVLLVRLIVLGLR